MRQQDMLVLLVVLITLAKETEGQQLCVDDDAGA